MNTIVSALLTRGSILVAVILSGSAAFTQPEITTITLTPEGVRLEWESVYFTLQEKSPVTSELWTNVSEAMGQTSHIVVPSASHVFYRLTAQVYLDTPDQPMYIGSYAKVPVLLASGLSIDQLEFRVPTGPAAGRISLSRDEQFAPTHPDIMLLAGYQPGDYTVEALEKGSGQVLAGAPFSVTDHWDNDELGPSLWLEGVVPQQIAMNSAFGGGPSSPQNIDVHKATGTRSIAIVFVDTSSERYTSSATTFQGFQDTWMDEVARGVTVGAQTLSTAHYCREVSYFSLGVPDALDVSVQVFGPVHLTKGWADYFYHFTTLLSGDTGWGPRNGLASAAVFAADSLVNYNNVQTVLLVFQEVSADPATGVAKRFAWPFGSVGSAVYKTAEGDKSLSCVFLPNDWTTGGANAGRRIGETVAHELGHNFGLSDDYEPEVAMPTPPPDLRNPFDPNTLASWSPMAFEGDYPHHPLATRMMLGWVPASWIEPFNFALLSAGSTVNQVVTLSPIEGGQPPSGRKAGIEIRIADGWNYYCEYRVGQSGHIGDQHLPSDNHVLVTDVVSPTFSAPIARPPVLLVANDEDGDGSVLGVGQDYKEREENDGFPMQLTIKVEAIDSSKADVRVTYDVLGKPDPSIRPWPASPQRRYQSPDVEVQNTRSLADAKWFNVPWVDHENTIIANVSNRGNVPSPGVLARFYVRDYGIGGPEVYIGEDTHDIGAGATVPFQATWTPPREGHFCVIVRIPLYQNPNNPALVEVTELNNAAQSNYDRFISASSSPPARMSRSLNVGNPYEEVANVILSMDQANPIYRAYIEHRWLRLGGKGQYDVKTMFEYAPDDRPPTDPLIEEFGTQPNAVGVTALIWRPEARHPWGDLTSCVLGGVDVEVATGVATTFAMFDVDHPRYVFGQVVSTTDQQPVAGGKVIVTAEFADEERHVVTDVNPDGSFNTEVPEGWLWVEGYYVPAAGFADSTSERVLQ